MEINITLPGGDVRSYPAGTTAAEVAKSLGMGLYKAACAARINGTECDLRAPITSDCALEILTFEQPGGRFAFRHTAAHMLAQAVKRLFPAAKLATGPAIENGFFYDFEVAEPFSADDLTKLEAEIKKIAKEDIAIERFTLPADEAAALMSERNEPYKLLLIEEHAAAGDDLSFYKQDEFVDLCAGPHLMSTGAVKAVKLTQTTGAYWKGDSANTQLCRVYGTAFPKAAELEEYLIQREEALKRDHNVLGRQLGYFVTSDIIGQGLPLLAPKGAKVIQILQRFVEDEEEKRGYVLTKTPFMAKSELYKVSGHWDHYRDGMFILDKESGGGDELALRPMTCPFQFTIYNATLHSYRDLPIRYNETSTLFRNESSGEMHGLIRVRQFTLSEGHLVVTPEHLADEFAGVVDLVKFMMDKLGIADDVWYRFSLRDPDNKDKYIDDDEAWNNTESRMRGIITDLGIQFEEAIGEAAFYGPKLDIQMKNVHGKEDTIITIQIDFSLASRFNMTYIDENGEKKTPYIIHRSSIGCYERTLALLLEKYAGALPYWLAPEQVRVLPISEKQHEKAAEIREALSSAGARVHADLRNEKIGYKIREAQMDKIPFMLIVGDKEVEEGTVSVRSRADGDLGAMSLQEFLILKK